jgi:hypothetical protein
MSNKKKSWHTGSGSALAWALTGAAALAALVVFVRSVPDIVRYVRVERM